MKRFTFPKIQTRTLAIAVTLIASSLSGVSESKADTPEWAEGVYLRALGGASFLADSDTTFTNPAENAEATFDVGNAAGLALGYNIDDNWSAEFEYMYRSGDLDSFSKSGLATGGDLASVILTGNVLYQFEGWTVMDGQRLRPYAGIGLGLTQEVDFDIEGGSRAGEYSDGGEFAYQLRGGVNWWLSDNWLTSAELRFLDAGNVELGDGTKADYRTVDLLVGVGYQF